MFVRSGNVSLRAIEPSDVALLYQWENDPTVWRISDTITPFSIFQLEQFILNCEDIYASKQLRMMIDIERDEKKITIGNIDLFDFDPTNRRAGLGIFIDGTYRQNGYAATALQLCENYAFETLDLHQVYCLVAADNMPSIKLFESRNYLLTGTRKEWLKRNSLYLDQLQYQLFNPLKSNQHK